MNMLELIRDFCNSPLFPETVELATYWARQGKVVCVEFYQYDWKINWNSDDVAGENIAVVPPLRAWEIALAADTLTAARFWRADLARRMEEMYLAKLDEG